MLTNDLVRTRSRNGQVMPLYLDVGSPEARARATALVEIFEQAQGWPRARIDGAVEEVVGFGTDFLVWRGLAKLLYDRCTFAVDAPIEPEVIRRTVFELAARPGHRLDDKGRALVLEQAATLLGIDAQACHRALYADLEQRQVLVAYKALDPEKLLSRYNLALAQAVLYRATTLTITVKALDSNRLRYLFQLLKFHRLMHRVRKLDDGYEITLDGPSSLFSKNRKYGLQMAKFLPALINVGSFHLVADLAAGLKTGEVFQLSEADGLSSHYKMKGQWISKEEKWFEERFAQLETDWRLERRGTVIELDANEVLVADYVLIAPDGFEVYLEIVGFWRLAYLERRLDKLRRVDSPALVLVVAERLKAGREKLEQGIPEVIFFKGVILADRVLEAARAVAQQKGR
jgi:uncharacterized protein